MSSKLTWKRNLAPQITDPSWLSQLLFRLWSPCHDRIRSKWHVSSTRTHWMLSSVVDTLALWLASSDIDRKRWHVDPKPEIGNCWLVSSSSNDICVVESLPGIPDSRCLVALAAPVVATSIEKKLKRIYELMFQRQHLDTIDMFEPLAWPTRRHQNIPRNSSKCHVLKEKVRD